MRETDFRLLLRLLRAVPIEAKWLGGLFQGIDGFRESRDAAHESLKSNAQGSIPATYHELHIRLTRRPSDSVCFGLLSLDMILTGAVLSCEGACIQCELLLVSSRLRDKASSDLLVYLSARHYCIP